MSGAVHADLGTGTHRLLVGVLAVATGALVANLYYAQPLIATIGPGVGVTPGLAGAVTSLTQVGYGIGLFFLVPLADLVENKRLVLATLLLTTASLLACGVLRSVGPFFVASFLVGLASSGAQVLLPFVAHLAPEARRGQVVGNVMACVLAGIMLARPVALFVAGSFGWRSVFWCAAGLMALVGLLLAVLMPRHQPESGLRYGQILRTMAGICGRSATLRRRATRSRRCCCTARWRMRRSPGHGRRPMTEWCRTCARLSSWQYMLGTGRATRHRAATARRSHGSTGRRRPSGPR